jgi:hypothetical protein
MLWPSFLALLVAHHGFANPLAVPERYMKIADADKVLQLKRVGGHKSVSSDGMFPSFHIVAGYVTYLDRHYSTIS